MWLLLSVSSLSSSTCGDGTLMVVASRRILFTTDTHLNTKVWGIVCENALLNSPSTDRTDGQTDGSSFSSSSSFLSSSSLLFLLLFFLFPSITGHSQPRKLSLGWFSIASVPYDFLRPEGGALGNIYLALLYFVISLYTKVQEGCKSGGGDVEVMPGINGDCFQLCLTRFLGCPIGGIC